MTETHTVLKSAEEFEIDQNWSVSNTINLNWSSAIFKMVKAAADIFNANIGYDQAERWSFFDRETKTIIPNREGDCSSICGAIAALGGFDVDLSGARSGNKRFYSGNAAVRLEAVGFTRIPYSDLNQLQVGDFIIGPGHMEFIPEVGKMFSATNDENGAATGGSAGNQTGKETRFTNAYNRKKGWTCIMRPPSEERGGRKLPTNEEMFGVLDEIIASITSLRDLYNEPVEPEEPERPVNSFDSWEEAVEYYNLPRNLDYIYWDYDGPNDVWEQHKRIGEDAVLVLRERDEPYILNSSKGFPAAGVGWIDGPDGTRTPVVHDPNRWFEMSRGNVLGLGPRAVIEVGESDWTAPAQPYPMWYYDRNGVKKSELVGNQNKLLQTVSEVGIFANFTLKGRDLGDVCYSGVGFSGCRKSHLHDVRFVEASRGGEPIPNTETGAAVFYGGTNENQQFAYFISGVEIWNHESRSSSPLMFNRMSSGKVSDLTMHNAPAYGMPAYWRCWGLHIWQDSIVRSPKSGMNFEGCKNFDLVINWCTVNAGPGSFHFNIDPYGGSVNISALDLAYSTDGYVKDKVVYHAFHAHNPKMPVVQRDIDIAGDHPKALIPKERWLLTNQ